MLYSLLGFSKKMTATEIKAQLKPLILSSLRITDMCVDDLRDDQALLGGDLEIDSVDILQLIIEIERHFGTKLVTGRFDRETWRTVESLASAIGSKLREPVQA